MVGGDGRIVEAHDQAVGKTRAPIPAGNEVASAETTAARSSRVPVLFHDLSAQDAPRQPRLTQARADLQAGGCDLRPRLLVAHRAGFLADVLPEAATALTPDNPRWACARRPAGYLGPHAKRHNLHTLIHTSSRAVTRKRRSTPRSSSTPPAYHRPPTCCVYLTDLDCEDYPSLRTPDPVLW